MSTPASPTFCALPFGHLFLSEEGKSYPCCYALESQEYNRDEAGRAILVEDQSSLERAWNSPTQRKIRQQMMAGEKPSACRRCFLLEAHGLHTLRETSNRTFLAEGLMAAKQMASDGSLPPRFYSLDLRLGNACNLRCQMCSPVSSIGMVRDFQKLYPEQKSFEPAVTWFKDKKVLEFLLLQSETIREAHFAGGEPFLIPEVAWFLEKLVHRGVAANCLVSFNTNATTVPLKLLELLPNFKEALLILSLDGIDEVNDYIRYPSKFAQLHKNILTLQANQKRWNLRKVCFNITVQIHNIFQLPEIIRYTSRFDGFIPFPILGPLNSPECLSIQALPTSLKMQVRKTLEDFINEERSNWKKIEHLDSEPGGAERFERHVQGLIEFMFDQDRSASLGEFHRFTEAIEKIRGFRLPVPGLSAITSNPDDRA